MVKKLYNLATVIKDRIAFDLPLYDGLLAGHFRRGPGYGRHRPGGTDDWLLVMTLAGCGRFGTLKGDLQAERGSLILISPGTTHDYGTSKDAEEWDILWVHFKPPADWLDYLAWPIVAPGIHRLDLPQTVEIEAALRETLRLSVSIGPRRKQFAMNALERLLLLCDAATERPGHRIDARILAAVEYIHGHLSQDLSLGNLSKRVHLSPHRFAHLFRREMGVAPGQYILAQRLQRVRTLLERTTLGVAEIAAEVGMDPYYLSLRFRREMGISPRQFRKGSRHFPADL